MGRVRIGVAGWSYRDWDGIVYPNRAGRRFDQLSYLAGYFDVIEANVTFYRLPQARNSISWVKRTSHNPEFRFTVKLHRHFTHERDALSPSDEIQWREGLEPLQEAGKLGAVLVQFPYSFHCNVTNQRYLARLVERFPEYPLVVEVRHRSWDSPETFQFFSDIGIGFCNIDQPRVSYSILPSSRVTSPLGYIRLHGQNVRDWFRKNAGRDARYNYLYSEVEIAKWLGRIKETARQTRELYVITNNHYRGQAVCNALQLKASVTNRKVPVPSLMIPVYPQLKRLRGGRPIMKIGSEEKRENG
ncbi:MAG: DUF72 domain-containing protein [Candidatus Euphemobacter frigidus]|nr:DUF72 domain-containing protein [Candidatus Euphemobacter frigidus]MDP8275283.1 DUF72 domain-containing protein [Candidatus Euphemobacter frigidus]